MTNDPHDDGLLKEISEWRQRGADLRDRMLKERAALAQRLEEIDRALAELPNPEQLVLPVSTESPISEAQSTPDLVQRIVARHPNGIGASEIVRQAKDVKPDVSVPLLHAAIYRLVKAGKILATGKRGTKIYRPRQVGDWARVSDNPQAELRMVQPRHPRAGKISPVSLLGQSISVLRDEGKPLHAKAIVDRLRGRTGRKINFASLVGALARATKTDQSIVCRTGENVFALVEWTRALPRIAAAENPEKGARSA